MAMEVYHDVLRLQVSVDSVPSMQCLEGEQYFRKAELGLILSELGLTQMIK